MFYLIQNNSSWPVRTAQVPGGQYLVAKYAYQARLPDVTPHTLCYTFGKNLVDGGVSLKQVAALLGHESLDTMMLYTKPSHDDLKKAVRKAAGELLDGAEHEQKDTAAFTLFRLSSSHLPGKQGGGSWRNLPFGQQGRRGYNEAESNLSEMFTPPRSIACNPASAQGGGGGPE
jgi:hypothetical protein